jgi:hypothetical protein
VSVLASLPGQACQVMTTISPHHHHHLHPHLHLHLHHQAQCLHQTLRRRIPPDALMTLTSLQRCSTWVHAQDSRQGEAPERCRNTAGASLLALARAHADVSFIAAHQRATVQRLLVWPHWRNWSGRRPRQPSAPAAWDVRPSRVCVAGWCCCRCVNENIIVRINQDFRNFSSTTRQSLSTSVVEGMLRATSFWVRHCSCCLSCSARPFYTIPCHHCCTHGCIPTQCKPVVRDEPPTVNPGQQQSRVRRGHNTSLIALNISMGAAHSSARC